MSRTASHLRQRQHKSRDDVRSSLPHAAPSALSSHVAERIATPTAGEILPNHTEGRLRESFGHSFGEMRVHYDASADELSRALDARAFAAGDHLFFRAGEYAPDSPAGFQLLAHEAAHVAARDQSRDAQIPVAPALLEVVDENHASERAAHEAADAVVSGENVGVATQQAAAKPASSAGAVVVQRWPWDDDTPSDANAANTVSAPTGSLTGMLSSVGGAIAGAAGSVYDFEKKGLSNDYNAAKSASAWWDKTANLDGFHKDFENMGDGLKSGVSAATNWADDETKGNSVLNSVVNSFGATANGVASIGSGAIKGVGDLATTAENTFIHPIDSAIGMAGGMWNMWEHTPVVGGGFKGLHGMYDLATGNEHGKYGSTMSELNKNLTMGAQMDSDIDFWAGIGGGRDAWAKDPFEAGSRTLTNFAPMLLGMEEGLNAGAGEGGVSPGGAPEAPIPEGGVPSGGVPAPEAPFDPSQPLDIDDIARRNPDLVHQQNSLPARQPGAVFRDEPLPLKRGPSELDNIRVKVAEQRGGGAEFSKKNARRR